MAKLRNVLSTTISIILITLTLFSTNANFGGVSAKDDSVSGSLFCEIIPSATGDDSYKDIYKLATTDEIPFLSRSISVYGGGVENVDYGFFYVNALLQIGNERTFKEVNESILGYPLDEGNVDGTGRKLTKEQIEKFNGGVKVSPYDRFGFAGLSFTGYNGEWKYYDVDPCSGSKPLDPKIAVFYEGRLEPRSTWDDVPATKDPRTKQFSYAYAGSFTPAFGNSFANFLFGVTKFIVAITLALLGFSFSNVTDFIGLTSFLSGESGLFNNLYDGVFFPLIVSVIALAGLHLVYVFFRDKGRVDFKSALRMLGTYIVAVILSVFPGVAVELPNTIATTGQSILISALAGSQQDNSGLCSSNVAEIQVDESSLEGKTFKEQAEERLSVTKKSVESLKSELGCKVWKTLLLEPWSYGQFGDSWEKFYANDNAPKDGSALGNANGEMVGDASVPLGGGESIKNWAIYHISTLTNAHANSKNDERPEVVNGVSTDWWRIVDALSNYDEVTVEKVASGENGKTYKVTEVKNDNKPLPAWDTWNGNSGWYRVWIAFMSVPIAFMSLIAPLLFGVKTAVSTIGLSLMGALAPLAFLAGCYPGKGFVILEEYLKLVGNLIASKVGYGLLTVLSIIIVSNALDSTGDYFTGLILASLGSYALYRGANRIIQSMQIFGGGSIAKAYDSTTNLLKQRTRDVSNLLVAGASGAVGARANGIKATEGFKAGIKNEVLNFTYRADNPAFTQARNSYHSHIANLEGSFEGTASTCSSCGKKIEFEEQSNGDKVFYGGVDDFGNLVCNVCVQSEGTEVDTEIWFHINDRAIEIDSNKKEALRANFSNAFKGVTVFDSKKNSLDELGKLVVDSTDFSEGSESASNSEIEKAIYDVLEDVARDIESVKESRLNENVPTPSIPKNLERFIDKNALVASYSIGRYDYASAIYANAVLRHVREDLNLDVEITSANATGFVYGAVKNGTEKVYVRDLGESENGSENTEELEEK